MNSDLIKRLRAKATAHLPGGYKLCAGAMPFSQLERDFSRTKTEYSAEWKAFERQWQRPAATVAHMREVDGHGD